MRVQATKKMANELNKALKGTRFEGTMHFNATKVDSDVYYYAVSDNLDIADYDYDNSTGMYRVMTVYYPDEYYAYPKTITGYELVKIFKTTGNNWDKFTNAVFEMAEV